MKRFIVAGAAAFMAATLGGAYAQANTIMIGSTLAKSCSEAALAGRTEDVEICTRALREGSLTTHEMAGTYVNRGALLLKAGNAEGAQSDFDQAAEIKPGLGEIYVNRGLLQVIQGRPAEALASINKGLELGVGLRERALFNRAIAREDLQDLVGAYRDYQEAARLAPKWELPRQELTRFRVAAR
jgi:tetratricopeptide (TPR) repeat protein